MDISIRLRKIIDLMENCECMSDIGTDHGYIPIELIQIGKVKRAIGSDIHKGPLIKAKQNISFEGLEDKIELRLGSGFNTLKHKEVQAVVVAGMGGNLIRDLIEERLDLFKELNYAILQPVQNPDILRKYIYEKGFKIMDEELVFEEGKFYEIMKVCYDTINYNLKNYNFEIGEDLIKKQHPLLKQFIEQKLLKYNKILRSINEDTQNAILRKEELISKINWLKELL